MNCAAAHNALLTQAVASEEKGQSVSEELKTTEETFHADWVRQLARNHAITTRDDLATTWLWTIWSRPAGMETDAATALIMRNA